MSETGTYVNDMWVSMEPSWYRRRMLLGRTDPHPNWVSVPLQMLGVLGWIPFVFLLGDWTGTADDLRFDRMVILLLGAGIWVAFWRGVVNIRSFRQSYRDKLVRSGELLTPDDPAGQMVLIPEVREFWDTFQDVQPYVARHLRGFAELMARGHREFHDPLWYLDSAQSRQELWCSASNMGVDSPLGDLGRLCGCLTELSENMAAVVKKQVCAHRVELRSDVSQLNSEKVKLEGEAADLKRRLGTVQHKLAERNVQLEYDPLAHVQI